MATSSGDNILVPDKNTILEHVFTEAILSNINSVQKWTTWKEDNEKLKKTLQDLPNKLSYPSVIPFGSKALVKANLVHTNEILSCIGGGYFIKQSAKQAIDMCERRIKESIKMLEDLEKEHNLIKSRQDLPKLEEAFPNEEQEEIIEEYDEEKEAEWRVYHREMEKKYHQELGELRKKREEEGPPQTEEDLFRRLDMLELEEELNDELDRLNEGTDSDEEEDENVSEKETEKQDSQEKDISKCNSRLSRTSLSEMSGIIDDTNTSFKGYQRVSKSIQSLEPGQVCYGFTDREGKHWQKSVLTNTDEEENSAISALEKRRKSVSFASDDDDPDTQVNQEVDPNTYIRFNHSDNEFQEPPANQITECGDIIHINSPKDIYKEFAHLMMSSEPKSILKKNSSYEGESTNESILPSSQPFGSAIGLDRQDQEDDGDSLQPARGLSHLPPVLRDVLETNPSEPPASQPRLVESSRPVSRFKASRATSRR